MSNLPQIKQQLNSESSIKKFEEMLGKNARAYITSVISSVASNDSLQQCDPTSLLLAVGTAASLNLPVNPNLGFSYIVPYNSKKGKQAQFQIGYKGLIQLSQRSGLFKTINCTEVKEGEIVEHDRLTGKIKFNWLDDQERDKQKVVGYVAYFELLNGFSKSLYMTMSNIQKHATKFSKSYKSGFGVWKDDFDAMAKKTVIKLLLSKYAPMTVEIEKAVTFDQSIQQEENEPFYIDNKSEKSYREDIITLLPTAKIDKVVKDQIIADLGGYSDDQLKEHLEYLKEKQNG